MEGVDRGTVVTQEVQTINDNDLRAAMKTMKSGKAVGPDDQSTCAGVEVSRREVSGLFNQIVQHNLGQREDAQGMGKPCTGTNN